ncbi:MAG: DUF3299 domain-containing protein [Pseudazoarcus pumilus]|nr:DUF3299 domain-containing protein [Pseudazoarcus pumilus]
MMKLRMLLLALMLTAGPALAQQGDYQVGDRVGAAAGKMVDGYLEIEWDDLIPKDWMPEKLFEDLFNDENLDKLDDTDPRAAELMQKVREAWDNAPLVSDFNGKRVRIPGFVVPLEGDAKTIREFLLVPYFGACIHVPPPPANQLILVKPDKPIKADWNMVPVWVSGVMEVERKTSELGTSGYSMKGLRVVEYE